MKEPKKVKSDKFGWDKGVKKDLICPDCGKKAYLLIVTNQATQVIPYAGKKLMK